MHAPLRAGLGLLATLALALAPQPVSAEPLEPRAGQAMASSLVASLNAGDAEAVVALFDLQATIAADRMAWRAQDVRQWAELQIVERIKVEPTASYEVVGNRVKWTARVWRRDWRERGVEPLEVWDAILVDHGRIIAFMSQPSDSHQAGLLGDRWRPDAPPDPPRDAAAEPAPPTELKSLALGALLTITGLAASIVWAGRRTRARRLRADTPRHAGVRLVSLAKLAAAKRAAPATPATPVGFGAPGGATSPSPGVGEVRLCEVL